MAGREGNGFFCSPACDANVGDRSREVRNLAGETKDKVRPKGEGYGSMTGVVVPVDWDDKGLPNAVALLTPGGNDYYIEPDDNGNALLELVTKEVDVHGEVKKGRYGQSVLVVQTHELKTGEEPCIIE